MYQYKSKDNGGEEKTAGRVSPDLNKTGIPTPVKDSVEARTGVSFDDVRVHYNSGKPMQLRALAFTLGNEVYIGPGQERHLPHELGHVAQQKAGLVRPTTSIGGVPVNDDPGLERAADSVGGNIGADVPARYENVVQRMPMELATFKESYPVIYDLYYNERMSNKIWRFTSNPGENIGWAENTGDVADQATDQPETTKPLSFFHDFNAFFATILSGSGDVNLEPLIKGASHLCSIDLNAEGALNNLGYKIWVAAANMLTVCETEMVLGATQQVNLQTNNLNALSGIVAGITVEENPFYGIESLNLDSDEHEGLRGHFGINNDRIQELQDRIRAIGHLSRGLGTETPLLQPDSILISNGFSQPVPIEQEGGVIDLLEAEVDIEGGAMEHPMFPPGHGGAQLPPDSAEADWEQHGHDEAIPDGDEVMTLQTVVGVPGDNGGQMPVEVIEAQEDDEAAPMEVIEAQEDDEESTHSQITVVHEDDEESTHSRRTG